MDQPDRKPKRRPRVSLLSLFLLTALVATSVTTAMLWWEVEPLRSEVARLRVETGQLTIEDPEKLYAVSIDTIERDTWKWRVYLPGKQDFQFETSLRRIAGRAFEMSRARWFEACGTSCTSSVGNGEFLLTLRLENDRSHPNGKGHWNVHLQAQQQQNSGMTTFGGGVCGTVMPWLADRRVRSTTGDTRVGGPQITKEPKEGIELLTLRRAGITDLPNGWSSVPPDLTKDCDGISVRIVSR